MVARESVFPSHLPENAQIFTREIQTEPDHPTAPTSHRLDAPADTIGLPVIEGNLAAFRRP